MTTPWFFLSYSSADDDEKECIVAFYRDLVNEVRRKGGLKGAADCAVGFLDCLCLEVGTLWWPDIAKSAQTARTMVCLYSPNYFESEYCLRELGIFGSRLAGYENAADPAKRPHRVLPVLWEKPDTLPAVLPGGVGRIQNNHQSLGGEYAKEGLLFLKKTNREGEYKTFLDRFATKVVAEARAGNLPPAPDDSPLLREPEGADAGSADGGAREAHVVHSYFAEAVAHIAPYDGATEIRAPPPEAPPKAPDDLRAAAASPSRVGLTWRDNSGGRAGFKVERRPGRAGEGFEDVGRAEPGSTFFGDAGLSPWTGYTYRVRASVGEGDSDYSNEVSVITPPRNWVFKTFVEGFAPDSLRPSSVEDVRRPRLRLNYTRLGGALALVVCLVLLRPVVNSVIGTNPPPTPTPTPTPGAMPKLETDIWDEHFNRKQVGAEWVWITRDEWEYPSDLWMSVDGVDGAHDYGDILVKGTRPGVNKEKVFGDFEATFTIDYVGEGAQAGWVLRAGDDKAGERPGYYFVLKRPSEPEGQFLLSVRGVGAPGSRVSPPDCPLDINNYSADKDYIEVTVTATGNAFDYKFARRSHAFGAARATRAVGCLIRDTSPDYFKWGRIGFFAGDDQTTFRVEDITVDPKPLQK
jgi:hypothetical protein